MNGIVSKSFDSTFREVIRSGKITMVDLNEDPFGEFAWANVRLATYFSESSVQPRLLFGLVSLLTKDRPKPPGSTGIDSHKVGRGKHGKVFFKRTVLSASEAISWYRNAGEQNISTPDRKSVV